MLDRENIKEPVRASVVAEVDHGITQSNPDVRQKTITGTLWTAGQICLVKTTGIVAFIILGRQLQPAEFGVVALAAGFVTILSALAETGLGSYLLRQQWIDKRLTSTAFWVNTGLASIFTAALFLTAPLLAHSLGTPDLASILQAMSLVILISSLASVPVAILKRNLQFNRLALRASIASLLGASVAISLALSGAGAWALVAQALVYASIASALAWGATDWRPSLTWNPREFRAMAGFGLKLLGVDLLLQANDRGEEFVITAGSTSTLLGYWSVSTRLVRLIQDTGSQLVSTVATPTLAKLGKDARRLSTAYGAGVTAAGTVVFPAMLFLAATSLMTVPLILGNQWQNTAHIAQITAMTAAVGVFSYFDRVIYIAVDRLGVELLLAGVSVPLHLAIIFILLPLGLRAVALGLLVRALATLPVRLYCLNRFGSIQLSSLLPAARVLIAAILMSLAALVMSSWMVERSWASLAIVAAVSAPLYVVLLALVAGPVFKEYSREVMKLASLIISQSLTVTRSGRRQR